MVGSVTDSHRRPCYSRAATGKSLDLYGSSIPHPVLDDRGEKCLVDKNDYAPNHRKARSSTVNSLDVNRAVHKRRDHTPRANLPRNVELRLSRVWIQD